MQKQVAEVHESCTILWMDQIRPRTGFQRWLAENGDEIAAERLGVPRRTVKSWRLGDRIPRPAQARQIMERAEVTMDDIYGQPANDAPQQESAA